MDIIKMRQERRNEIISQINKTLLEAKEKGIEINKKDFILEICRNSGVGKRTAREYLDIAGYYEKL